MSERASRSADAGPPELAAGAEVDAEGVCPEDFKVAPGSDGVIVGAGVDFAGVGSGSLVIAGPLVFSSWREYNP